MFRGEKPGETRFAPDLVAARTSHATRSTSGSRPRTCRCPRTGSRSPRTATSRSATRPATRSRRSASTTSSRTMLADLGMHHGHLLPHHAYLKNEIPVAGCAHQAGTCRFGTDPRRSVLNTDCRAHELDNLYVVDTSFFPSIGAVNPALTAMANALRVGDHLLERARTPHQPQTGAAPMPDERASSKRHVVIVGGGFAGLGCAQKLADHDDVHVTLIDRNNYHQFQPLLYQVATSQLAAERHRAFAARRVRRPGERRRASSPRSPASTPTNRTVTARATARRGPATCSCVAAGSQPNFFGTPGAAENSFPLYSLDNATRLRSRILGLFEQVDRDPSLVDRGALNIRRRRRRARPASRSPARSRDMIKVTVPGEYRNLDPTKAQICLLDFGDALLKPFSDSAHGYVAKVLEDKGVEIHLGTGVKEVGTGHAVLSDGTVHPDPLRGLGRRHQGRRGRRRLWLRPGTGRARRRPARPDARRQPRRLRRRRHRQHRRPRRPAAAAARIGRAPERRHGPRTTSSPASRARRPEPFALPRQGDHGDDRPRRGDRRGRQAPPRDPR